MSRKRRTDQGDYFGLMSNTYRNRGNLTHSMYYRVLTELACSRFKWEGLPDSVDERYLELHLFRSALVVFYFDEEYDKYLALNGTPSGRINHYNNPTEFRIVNPAFSKTVYGTRHAATDPHTGERTMVEGNAIPIWGNTLRTPDWDVIRIYSDRLAQLDRTIDINCMALRHPFIIACNESEQLSLSNAFKQVQEGQPVIWGTQLFGETLEEKIKVLDVGLDPKQVTEVMVAKSRIWNEAMTFLGINNANQDKKERLVADEVSANDSQVMSARMVALNARRMAVEQINEKWGDLDISVDWNADLSNPDMPGMGMGLEDANAIEDNMSEGGDDAEVYNASEGRN